MNAIRDLPLFAKADEAKMGLCCANIAGMADGVWRTKHQWAAIAGCAEHPVSARFSDLRKRGFQVDRRPIPDDGSGERVKLHEYRVTRVSR